MRWILSIAIVAAVTAFHVNLLWIVPTLAGSFITALILLRFELPSARDHNMRGYLAALRRPENHEKYAGFAFYYHHVHTDLGLKYPLCEKVHNEPRSGKFVSGRSKPASDGRN